MGVRERVEREGQRGKKRERERERESTYVSGSIFVCVCVCVCFEDLDAFDRVCCERRNQTYILRTELPDTNEEVKNPL